MDNNARKFLISILDAKKISGVLDTNYCISLFVNKAKPWKSFEDLIPASNLSKVEYDVLQAHRKLFKLWLELNGCICTACNNLFDSSIPNSYIPINKDDTIFLCNKCSINN